MTYRTGIDLGGTKTEFLVLAPNGEILLRRRCPTPTVYDATLAMLATTIAAIETEIGATTTIGIGIPGTNDPVTGRMITPNTPALNGQPFTRDFAAFLGREIRTANDANCFALSEASDGAGAGAATVFGVILGTGCGSGIVIDGRIITGRNGIAGEFGHTPLPWPGPADLPLRPCPCGRFGCIERYVAGPALACEVDGPGAKDATHLLARAAAGDEPVRRAFAIHAERLARGLAAITTLLDPDVIVLGGGLSNLPHLYTDLPRLMRPYVYAEHFSTNIVQARHGDSSGVRGAAWLWPA